MPDRKMLLDCYVQRGMSTRQIAGKYRYSVSGINYLLRKFKIPKRSISDAIYLRKNPYGDPFIVSTPRTLHESFLLGLGVGLYWGEGNKRNSTSVRLGNSDPDLILCFIKFLRSHYKIELSKLRFGVQVFSDTKPAEALHYWSRVLRFPMNHFQTVVVTPSRGDGTYRQKSPWGVVTVYFNNKKLKNILCSEIEKLRSA